MKLFVTGASGHVGSVVLPELIKRGHSVVGLARSDESAAGIEKMGGEAISGSLDDMELLESCARESDGVIHLAFKHDIAFSGQMPQAIQDDMKALQAMAKGLEGSNKPLVGVSGTMVFASTHPGKAITEDDTIETGGRADAENFVIGLAEKGVRSSVVRLAPTVHGPFDKTGFVPTLIRFAREKGFAGYVGEGKNRWPALHDFDAGALFALAAEKAPAGSRLHGVAEEGVAFKDIAEAIGQKLGVPAQSVPQESAQAYFEFLSYFAGADSPASSAKTQHILDWHPSHPGLVEDLETGEYFS